MWKNVLLIAMFLVGLLYAIPNLYSEDPVIQISNTRQGESVSPEYLASIQTALHQKGIASDVSDESSQRVLIRFRSTDQQLQAFDVIKSLSGEAYTVALNLEPATPSWMRRFGAEPMKQGLDLRGGIHFLLEVDIDSVVSRRYEGMLKTIGQMLRDQKVRYVGLRRSASQGLEIQFRDATSQKQALTVLSEAFPGWAISQSNQKNVTPSVYVTLTQNELNQIRQNTIEQTMTILRNRVNELGVGEAVVQQQGASRVSVDLPGIQDATRAKQILGGTATLEFHMVDQEHDPMVAMRSGVIPLQSKLYKMAMCGEIPLLSSSRIRS